MADVSGKKDNEITALEAKVKKIETEKDAATAKLQEAKDRAASDAESAKKRLTDLEARICDLERWSSNFPALFHPFFPRRDSACCLLTRLIFSGLPRTATTV